MQAIDSKKIDEDLRKRLGGVLPGEQRPDANKNIYDPSIYNVSFNKDLNAQNAANLASIDPDVRAAQDYMNRYNYGKASGKGIERKETGIRHLQEQAINRVALKKALAESISTAPELEKEEERLLMAQAGGVLDTGLEKTRKNYSDRGLLYSGMRQGAEQGVRGAVAGGLAQSRTQAKRDLENLLTKQKSAFASIGLGDYQQKLEMANQAFEESYKNKIARQQAMQQMFGMAGMGLGMMAGQKNEESLPKNTSSPY